MRRMLLTILTLLLAATAIAGWTFAHLAHLPARPWTLLPMLLTAGFVPATMLSRRIHTRPLAAFNFLTGISVGFLSFFLLGAFASWFVVGCAGLLGLPLDGRIVAYGLYGAGAVLGLYSLANSFRLRVTRIAVSLPNLPPYWNGRCIALATDIHLGNFRGLVFSRRVVARLLALKPELILVGGDMFDGAKLDVDRSVEPWAALTAPSGVYFVEGNHDAYGDRSRYLEALRRAGMRILNNEKVLLHGLQLVGVQDGKIQEAGVLREALELAKVERGSASILLAHRPSNLSVPEEAGISLQLSGHTHGGQFWPWTLVAKRAHGKFAYGLRRLGRMLVFTSSGAGTWGPPFRLGTRSEVVLIRLAAA
jgi:predicted MPP superfamily phosphohydrolase